MVGIYTVMIIPVTNGSGIIMTVALYSYSEIGLLASVCSSSFMSGTLAPPCALKSNIAMLEQNL